MDLMARLERKVKLKKQKIQHMQKSAERGRSRVRSTRGTRGTAGGGCGRRAMIVLMPPLWITMASTFSVAVLSAMMIMQFAPHYI